VRRAQTVLTEPQPLCFLAISTYNPSVKKRRIVSVDPDVMGGTPCFAGTRVPVQTLLDYLQAGDSIDDFLEGFPIVRREQVIAFMKETRDK
jgi:uncharacterized protein (DUF433 family)